MKDTYWANYQINDLPPYLCQKVANYYEFAFRYGILDR